LGAGSGRDRVTVNSLLPGGATDTGMVPGDMAPQVRRQLLRPEIVVQPLLWLASKMADEVTGARFAASLWDTSLPPALAAEKARSTPGSIIPVP
jgi:NAD(P)-dependent dehydrogenase (short-subunit alcohol dehydrogenase family)